MCITGRAVLTPNEHPYSYQPDMPTQCPTQEEQYSLQRSVLIHSNNTRGSGNRKQYSLQMSILRWILRHQPPYPCSLSQSKSPATEVRGFNEGIHQLRCRIAYTGPPPTLLNRPEWCTMLRTVPQGCRLYRREAAWQLKGRMHNSAASHCSSSICDRFWWPRHN
jgi:hypothetical protein